MYKNVGRSLSSWLKSVTKNQKITRGLTSHPRVSVAPLDAHLPLYDDQDLDDRQNESLVKTEHFIRPRLHVEPRTYKLFSRSQIPSIFARYVPDGRLDLNPYMAASSVLPMRANNYVLEELIDWNNIPDDPIFQLVFPQPGMLLDDDLKHVQNLLMSDVDRVTLRREVEKIREGMNPHPAQQKEMNVPKESGEDLPGMQHKYTETLLFFPSEGQYCQSFCTYCFRWAQFTSVGSSLAFQSSDVQRLCKYLREHKCISDVLFTGGDPMVMTAKQWDRYLTPIVEDPDLDHIATIRIGSKSLAYWPYRYLCDPDSDDILRLFEKVVNSGRHLAFMAHFSHPHELSTPAVQEAVRRIHMTGAVIRAQAPLIAHVNDNSAAWAHMWRAEMRLGIVPYYMFVESDTGAKHYFEVPLVRALQIYNDALSAVSGSCRTVRGPAMSNTPGKTQILAVTEINGEKVIVLKFIVSRNPAWMNRLFFAKYDEQAVWLDGLKPAFGEEKFFFEDELEEISSGEKISGAMFPYEEGFEYQNMVLK